MTAVASATAWGSDAAFAAVYERHAPAARRVAQRILRGPSAADDVVQEAFLALWRSSYDPAAGAVDHYLLRIVRNCAVDRLRRERTRRFEPAPETHARDAFAEVEQLELARLVRDALQTLPRPQREALELAYFADLTQAQIAERLGEPLGTVKSRIRLGLHKLAGTVPSLA